MKRTTAVSRHRVFLIFRKQIRLHSWKTRTKLSSFFFFIDIQKLHHLNTAQLLMRHHLISLNAHVLSLPRLKIKCIGINLCLPYVFIQGMVSLIYYRVIYCKGLTLTSKCPLELLFTVSDYFTQHISFPCNFEYYEFLFR